MIIIKTSSDNQTNLEEISKTLLSKKLAACINLIPNCTSYFNWKGKLNKNKESLLLIKTTKKNENAIFNIIGKMHTYKTPEIISLSVDNVASDYSKWLLKETGNND